MKTTHPQQDAPFCIDIEATEGCNLRCDFCGIQAIRESTGGYKFMTAVLADKIASSIAAAGWNSRIEISGHGEPTMNPELPGIVAAFRHHLPRNQILVTSNGGGLLKDTQQRIDALFAAGLNILALDNYEHVNIVPKLRERQRTYDMHEYPAAGLDYSPHRRWPRGTRVIIILEDISAASAGVHSHINNRSGQAAPPTNAAQGKRCVKPFRDMVIRWDGRVNSCCNDYRGILHMGDARKQSVMDIWNGDAFIALRKFMYHGMREFTPCKGCDFVGFRVGLLPDKLGKQTLPRPDAYDRNIIARAHKGHNTMTPIVWREWEKKGAKK